MAKKVAASTSVTKAAPTVPQKGASSGGIVQLHLSGHAELQKYGDNALPLMGLGLFLGADDFDELATNAMTDGSNDKKIDFCHIDRTNRYAVIAQGYTAKQWLRHAAPANKASDLIAAVGWLFTGDISKVPSKLRAVAQELRQAIKDDEIIRIDFLYIHNCVESTNVDNELRTAASTAQRVLNKPGIAFGHAELGITQLEGLCLSSESKILVQDSFTIPGRNVIVETGDVWESVMTSMPGDWLRDLYLRYNTRLFSANYRDYLGMRSTIKNINFGIKSSAQREPKNFWTYNNGITALTRRITKSAGKFEIEGVSIINGAQTTGSIGECSISEAEKIKIPCRFVCCRDNDVLHNIIRFNNTQNAFRSSDQRSSDEVQRRLATELRAYNLSYIHRRSGATSPRSSISAESIAPLLCAFHGDPQSASRRRNDIFDLDTLYERVFPKTCTGEHVLLVHCLGLALDEVKYALKVKDAEGAATTVETINYEVLKYSTSKLFMVRIMGSVVEQICGAKVADLYRWRFHSASIKPDLQKLVFPWVEAVEAVLPIVASTVSNPYEAVRDFAGLPNLELRIAATVSGLGNHFAQRFAPLKDVTEI